MFRSDRVRDKAFMLNTNLAGTLKHISGLPIPKDAETDVYFCSDRIVFVGCNQEILVGLEKVTSVDMVNGSGDPSKQMSDAATGMLLFGAAGAAIGAMSSGTTCLVITYNSDGESKFIVLDGSQNRSFVKKVIKDFNQNRSKSLSSKKISL